MTTKRKTILSVAAVLLIIIAIMTCGRNKHQDEEKFEARIKPETTSISGDLSGYLQIVDNEYEVTKDMMYNLTVKIKAIKPYPASALKNKEVTLTISLLGDNGMPISDIQTFSPYPENENVISLLTKGSGEEIVRFTALATFAKPDPSKVKKFAMSSTVKVKGKNEVSQASSSSSTDDNASGETGPSEYDEMLDTYEKNTDDYIELIGSMDNNDIGSAAASYASVIQSTIELERKLKAAKSSGKMSAGQISRMIKIQSKMLKAMQKSNMKK